MTTSDTPVALHILTAQAVAVLMAVRPEVGLSSAQALERLARLAQIGCRRHPLARLGAYF